MQFKQCIICNLNLPISIMQPIQVNNNGRIIVVSICDNCKERKKQESMGKNKWKLKFVQNVKKKLNIKEFYNNKIQKDKLSDWCKLCTKKYYNNHKEEMDTYYKNYRLKNRKLVLNHYGNKCICCGEKRKEFLAIDHINNNGNILRKIKKIRDICRWIIKNNFPKDLQILCHNCNISKGLYGYCPHNKEKEAREKRWDY